MNFHTIFDFSPQSNIQDWRVVNDLVMGGKSSGSFKINDEGFGIFEGHISLENNGGFSSLRYRFEKIEVKHFTKIRIILLGDGKKYQFRIKSDTEDNYSYISYFSTSGIWQTIEIPLNDMYPWFRGKQLDQPNFSNDSIEDIGFLIGNKKAENFKLVIDKMELF
ncbi:CIA30 family protein [Confluentibacter sediminis]|uniref:CIA30 family protein n=1 Tax=Confluentibacter sediminis TaxID=2219045 RepID=UPI000DAE9F0A|nr:CIA30 family protein [Confluentibacter sediminis]